MQDWDAAHARLHRVCEELGIIWLERETVVLHGVRFVGTTLWTDYDAIALLDEQVQAGDMSRLLRLREKSFARPTSTCKDGRHTPWRAVSGCPMREQALGCQNWLRQALAQPLTENGGGYALCTQPAQQRSTLWHGAGHGRLLQRAGRAVAPRRPVAARPPACTQRLCGAGEDAERGAWRCRVVANPLGYARKGEQRYFQPATSLTV